MDFSNYELNQAKSSLERIENALLRAKDALAVVTRGWKQTVLNWQKYLNLQVKNLTAMDDDYTAQQDLELYLNLLKN